MNPWPHISPDEIEAASKVLASGKINYWTGDECKQFEQEFAHFLGINHAIAVMNGTVALELALYALDIGPGDDVIVTSRTFLASASAIVARGARPVFADVDEDSQNITAKTIKAALTPSTKAIICVHLAGWCCEMDKIMALASEHDLYVIEDCAQAHGAKYQNKLAGTWGHISAFSFCQDKIMTTGGEGGMVVTNDEALWKKAWSYKDHGKGYDTVFNKEHPPGFRWLHESFGTNWRMTEMQAAIGRKQLEKLPGWLFRRNQIAKQLDTVFAGFDAVRVPKPTGDVYHAFYKYYVFIKPEMLNDEWSRDRIMSEIISQNVPCFSGSCSEIYLEKCFENNRLMPEHRLPVAKKLGETSLMFLVHPTLSDEDVQKMIAVIISVFSAASSSFSESSVEAISS